MERLILIKLRHGGYAVSDVPLQGFHQDMLFASTTIDEALAYMRNSLGPQHEQADKNKNVGEDFPNDESVVHT